MRWKSEELVRIEIIGDKRPDTGTLPKTRDDHGVTGRLLQLMIDREIVGTPGRTGGGIFVGHFPPDEAEKVKTWLKAQPEFKRGKPDPS
jgi:hypothetical protein